MTEKKVCMTYVEHRNDVCRAQDVIHLKNAT